MNKLFNIARGFCSAIANKVHGAAVAFSLGVVALLSLGTPVQAQIVVTDFTGALDDVETAVTGGMSATVTAALAIAGLIMAGLILWRVFKRLVSG